jgi:hypothetical protein
MVGHHPEVGKCGKRYAAFHLAQPSDRTPQLRREAGQRQATGLAQPANIAREQPERLRLEVRFGVVRKRR